MPKTNTCVSIDVEDANKIKDMGIGLSKFIQHAMSAVLSEGFDDYVMTLKVKMIADDLTNAIEEKRECQERIRFLDVAIPHMQELLEDAESNLNISRTVGRLSVLTQEINKYLIMEQYDENAVVEKYPSVIAEIKKLNPEFDMRTHRNRLMKIMGY